MISSCTPPAYCVPLIEGADLSHNPLSVYITVSTDVQASPQNAADTDPAYSAGTADACLHFLSMPQQEACNSACVTNN